MAARSFGFSDSLSNLLGSHQAAVAVNQGDGCAAVGCVAATLVAVDVSGLVADDLIARLCVGSQRNGV